MPQPIPKDKLLPRLTLAVFKRPRTAAVIWLIITVFGIASYTTLLKREGFPSVSIPIVIVSGSYAVNDPAKVDQTLAKPVSEAALKQADVNTVQTTSQGNFFTAVVQYKESADAAKSKDALQAAVEKQNLPAGARLDFRAPYFGVTGGESEGKVDATISLYANDQDTDAEALTAKAQQAVAYLNKQHYSQIDSFFVQNPFQTVTDQKTGQSVELQRSYDYFGTRESGKTSFRQSVIINVSSIQKADVIELDSQIDSALKGLLAQPDFAAYGAEISASNAPTIKESISELQKVLLEGLFAVLVIGSIIIAVRASVITVISMLTVLSATLGLLYLLHYSLNVITLFSLILALSLIVDDTIIMVEALDASRKREKTAKDAVWTATRKVSRAMVAATLTAALSFAPLAFVSGILGTFIRAIPVTIISALLISLTVALVFIPLFARFLLLGRKQMGDRGVRELAAGFEERMARGIARPMLWARHSRKREVSVGLAAVLIGVAFVASAVFIFSKVTFNIFPPTKDSNQIAVSLTFAPNVSIDEATTVSSEVNTRVSEVLGDNFVKASYYGLATNQTATMYVELTPYDKREPTATQLTDRINRSLANYDAAKVTARQLDIGPPSAGFAVNIKAQDRTKSEKLAKDVAAFLDGHKLIRPSGKQATIKDVAVDNTSVYKRTDSQPVLTVSAAFDGTDTTTLTTLAQQTVKNEFTPSRLAQYGLGPDVLSFDIGQEQENQDSFKSLAIAFPLVLLVIFVLLAVQFRSLLQPLLIFLAIPFSLFGVSLGLYLTNNPFSFFAMLGFFALIGLSIKNTILLTDFANQARRAGMGPVDAAVAALGERFRPLIATSLTAIFSLIPLAVTSPFWQGLAVVLIFGLASSTLLVITVFPYYYLGAEYLRIKSGRGARRLKRWILLER